MSSNPRQNFWLPFTIIALISLFLGGVSGLGFAWYYVSNLGPDASGLSDKALTQEVFKKVSEESAVISASEKASQAVVSIVVTKDVSQLQRVPGGFFETPDLRGEDNGELEVGEGTGFIVSSDGYIVTNKHVVDDPEAGYTVLTVDQEKYEAEVKDRDPLMDIAILKIEGEDLPTLELGDSSDLKVGQTVIAIGNALGEFMNTVSTGVISGLSRSIVAGGFTGEARRLTGLIQTDASIHRGNSGGPLLDISGRAIGINTATASGVNGIGFAIPINEVKSIIEDVKEHGRILRPWLGVRYINLNEEIIEHNDLEVEYGALIVSGRGPADLAVIPGSPADKADLRANDIIMEMGGEKISEDNPLADIITQYNPGDEVILKVYSKGDVTERTVELGERKDN